MKFLKWLGAVLVCLCLGACQQEDAKQLAIIDTPLVRTEPLLHTVVQLSIYHDHQEKTMAEAIRYIKDMEKLLSTNLEGSDVYRINHQAGQQAVKVDPRTYTIIKAAKKMAETSHGKFDISIGAVTNLWRIGDDVARLPGKEEIEAALPYINYRHIHLNDKDRTVFIEKGMTLELGAISKGYIADGVKTILKKHRVNTAIINLGGNVLVLGTSPKNPKEGWNVGVQNPDQVRGDTVGTVHLKDQSIVTSGIYERFLEVNGKKYHHIIDPKTGYPVENNISGVTVYTKTSLQGDELSTTLFLLGIKDGLKFINKMNHVEAVFIDKTKGVHLSKGLKDKFTLTNKEYHIINEN
ncbi:UNVERIFIED_CONTAM: FAD:protein FMN transferase [Streptococcus canis]|uniref:FAD:protein FMN transferase n=1 Tax=Streptococcus canis TaxID=1329 RepID=UPI000B8B4490|nr:FAD:protein FMN transferase [Streptococcus canis]QJD12317.1 FAD:protein FMN transferase [Streptococcus canis]VTR79986.1 membrane-associated lipoprotein [Streptococcus canis]GFG47776.1 FAD:protein FMN transferase [Streptococcus canis]GMX34935.1 FAD:protein FMN transferase [Streptococcus canis]GMX39757.1 FAD:protein FMN transferase [Streptococcus canis]